MNVTSIIIRLAVDADARVKIQKACPHIFDGYVVTGNGEVLSREENMRLDALNYFFDGLNFVNSSLTK